MNDFATNISKKNLWRYVNRKIKRSIHHYHVYSVITILFEEILSDLKNEKEIKIFNLGTLSLQKTKPRKYFDVRFQKTMQSEGHRILRFILAPVISKKLKKLLDIDKTFCSIDKFSKDH
jgi:nucleoid DNA-binding protein